MENFLLTLRDGPLRGDEAFPQGIRLHTIDIYLTELLREGESEVPADVLVRLLEPFLDVLAHRHPPVVGMRMETNIFNSLLGRMENDLTELRDYYELVYSALTEHLLTRAQAQYEPSPFLLLALAAFAAL